MNRRARQLWGFPNDVTREILGNRHYRDSDAIVFNGPISAGSSAPLVLPSSKPLVIPSEASKPLVIPSQAVSKPVVVPSDGVIHFPKEEQHAPHDKDYDEIDLSGSFIPKPTTAAPTMPPFAPLPIQAQATFAHCGSFTKDGVFVATTSDSGIYTFPNGTQVAYSKCEVLQALNTPG